MKPLIGNFLPINLKKPRDITKEDAESILRNLIEECIPEAYFNYKKIPFISEAILINLINFLEKKQNISLINKLKNAGLNFKIEETKKETLNLLKGEIIVISGTFKQHSREEYKNIIESNGGKNATSISSKTTFILAGEGMGPKKLEKAKELNIPIFSENEFLLKYGEKLIIP
ncbi:MAG: hypothetical protein KAQ75_05370 [Bacteroidales bacterium]|nr:hypothetical protein [Bacteroidales bacterium]